MQGAVSLWKDEEKTTEREIKTIDEGFLEKGGVDTRPTTDFPCHPKDKEQEITKSCKTYLLQDGSLLPRKIMRRGVTL